MRFTGRNAIITGAARGIGAATALRMAREGCAVGILDLDGAAALSTAESVNGDAEVVAAGGSAASYACDVTDEHAVADAFSRFAEARGGIDILVNNAGITRDNLLFKLEPVDWNLVIATNLTSAYLCAREAQKHMVKAKYGRIVSLSSRSALGNRGQANYAAAKAGVQGLTATLAIELGPFNITVNAVAPGYIATAMTAATAERGGATAQEHQRAAAERTPLRRVGEPEEVAAAIAFLASDDASYVSGQTLYINGGAR
ncbi:SDR family oxidoreductase [Homoserinimonas sp. A520]